MRHETAAARRCTWTSRRPHVDWSAGAVALLTEAQPWPASRHGRAGRGVVVRHQRHQRARHRRGSAAGRRPARRAAAPRTAPVVPWVLSAEVARRRCAAQAAAADRLTWPPSRARRPPTSAGRWRDASTFEHRAVVLGADRGQLLAGLERARRRRRHARSVVAGTRHAGGQDRVRLPRPGLAVGRAWASNCWTPHRCSPSRSTRARRRCAEFVDWSLIDVLRGDAGRARPGPRRRGAAGAVRGDGVAGRAVAVGRRDARTRSSVTPRARSPPPTSPARCRCATPRGWSRCAASCCVALSGRGGMVSLACERRPGARTAGGRTATGSASPRSTAARRSWSPARRRARRARRAVRRRTRSGPAGSTSTTPRTRLQVEAIRDRAAAALAGIEPRSTRTAFFSTVTGDLVDTADLDADYWYRNMRQTVQFDQAVRPPAAHGYRAFVESSPHPVLIAGIEDTVDDCTDAGDTDPVVVPTLGRDEGGLRPLPRPRPRRRSCRASRWTGARRCGGGRLRRAADVCLRAAAVLAVRRRRRRLRRRRASGSAAQRARAARRGRRAARDGRGGADRPAVGGDAAVAGRPRRRRRGAVPRRGLRRAGDPRRRRGRLPGRRRTDAAGAAGAARRRAVAGAGGGRRRRRVGPRAVSVFSRADDAGVGVDAARRGRRRRRAGRAGRRPVGVAAGRAPARSTSPTPTQRLAARGYGYGPAFRA